MFCKVESGKFNGYVARGLMTRDQPVGFLWCPNSFSISAFLNLTMAYNCLMYQFAVFLLDFSVLKSVFLSFWAIWILYCSITEQNLGKVGCFTSPHYEPWTGELQTSIPEIQTPDLFLRWVNWTQNGSFIFVLENLHQAALCLWTEDFANKSCGFS